MTMALMKCTWRKNLDEKKEIPTGLGDNIAASRSKESK